MTVKELLHRIMARYKYNPLYSKLSELTGKNILDKKWVFIIGCYNSGTTLLDQILASHPDISGLPDEGVMLTDQLSRPEDYGWRRMWYKCHDKMNYTIKGKKINPVKTKKHWSHFYDLNKPFLLEKSISNTTRLDFLNTHFTPVYFIHIVRNGYAVAEGIRRKAAVMPENLQFNEGKYPIELCAQQWVSSLKAVEKFKPKASNLLEIKYEDLCDDPLKVTNEICDFLKIESFTSDFLHHKFSIHEKSSNIVNMNERSFKKLTSADFHKINELCKPNLEHNNYKIKDEDIVCAG